MARARIVTSGCSGAAGAAPHGPVLCLGGQRALVLPREESPAAQALDAPPGTPLRLFGAGLPAEGLAVTLQSLQGDLLTAALSQPLAGAPAGSTVFALLSQLTAVLPRP